MLCITLKKQDGFRMVLPDGRIGWVVINDVDRGKVRLGIVAPKDVVIARAALVPYADRPDFVRVND